MSTSHPDPPGEILTLPTDPHIDYGSKGSLGLEDGRVDKDNNRGVNAFFADNHSKYYERPRDVDTSTWKLPPSDFYKEVLERLQAQHISPTAGGMGLKQFIPRPQLLKVMTPETIYQLLVCMDHKANHPDDKLKNSKANDHDDELKSLALDIRYGSSSREPCVAVFSALLIKGVRYGTHMDMTDRCFPLSGVSGNPFELTCQAHSSDDLRHKAPWENWYDCSHFVQISHFLSPPYFKGVKGKHVHLVLSELDVLPWVKFEPLAPTHRTGVNDGEANQQQKKAHDLQAKARGAFGEVGKVTIHGDQFDFEAFGIPRGKDHDFAVKTLLEPDLDAFNFELASLLPFQPHDNLSLLRVLATYEVRDDRNRAKYHFIFPLRDGNLWDFFERHDTAAERAGLESWMAGQCAKLTRALRLIHNERHYSVKHKSIDKNDKTLYGRHGDVKADNILYCSSAFPGRGTYHLEFADFGLGRLHTNLSRTIPRGSRIDTTATYQAPEFRLKGDQSKIGRKADVYSLGCVFLEFVTWLLQGTASAREDFTTARQEGQPKYEGGNWSLDYFFVIREEGNRTWAERNPKVTAWIDQLKNAKNGSQYTVEFLNLINEEILEPAFSKRTDTKRLQEKMDRMVEKYFSKVKPAVC